jgi:hypothetical protein
VISKEGLTTRIRDELLRVRDPLRRATIQSALIDPRQEVLEWSDGEMAAAFTGWIVGSIPDRDLELAYCDLGSGPPARWGAVLTRRGFGRESQWYDSLEQAFNAHFGAADSNW